MTVETITPQTPVSLPKTAVICNDFKLDRVNEPARSILEKYSKIPSREILEHVRKIRDEAFAEFPYPCIGRFSFLDLSISQSPKYPEILHRVVNGEKFLDLGCAFGQELRQLVYDGAPSDNLYGSDLHNGLMHLGYDLFRDVSTLKSRFIATNILEGNSDLISQLSGQMNIIYSSLFFHLFDWDQSLVIAKHVLRLLSLQPGSMITGRFVAYRDWNFAKEKLGSTLRFYFDLSSWTQLWKQVEVDTGSKLNIEHWEQSDNMLTDNGIGGYMLCFAITRQ
ncbi:uncharacterized protein P174DRAFT_425989 [Aspergillus novofumigatus IBT 16806]|uniref:Asnovolin E/Chermesin D methyltransferase nvfJ n=1 Tax=Aspergillus novofumigatus (strain IBT 16806) TaxID=1392255 RepID=NVFJ_ASPN1|nr:uncharacterized protein P174DRAFT_425989 [Aspergillus novofumigatus IBT 16806]A0A2I1BSV7.1 RecName: Full=Asnovolin E/Chermesin D methyltransferase nvfJ; AltName: Full=Novofumigatonin biosynthesis cluster protein J [Aspergillus novofumigatus IBT 16806]PKX88478.1 hypothetical protein P174DRAFT_425989 [Aspergillus novofumigatus IBT 16806]